MGETQTAYWKAPPMWEDETVFILGGGPSVRTMDLSGLRGRRVIGCNDAYMLGADMVPLTYFGDRHWWEIHNAERLDVPGRGTVAGLPGYGGLVVTCSPDPCGDCLRLQRREPGFHDPPRVGWWGNTGASAINLAAHLGAARVVLLGFDMKLAPDGTSNWHPNLKDSPKETIYKRFLKQFERLVKELADSHYSSMEVVNATPGSALTLFPVTTLEKELGAASTPGRCWCGARGGAVGKKHHLAVTTCPVCGTERQEVPKSTSDQYVSFYREAYHKGVYEHSFKHDTDVALKRLRAYNVPAKSRLLDVGAGNGAFVGAARAAGVDAWGVEPGRGASLEPGYTYEGTLAEQHFPTEYFQTVTLHDVLEHLPDPVADLREAVRVCAAGGRVILDVPRFHVKAGVKHWKPREHLWFFNEDQLRLLCEEAGLVVKQILSPIPSKLVVYAEPTPRHRTSVLVPPGIGDILWSLVKMPGFCRRYGITGEPDVRISSTDPTKDRALEYVRRVSGVFAGGYVQHDTHDPIWREAYTLDARSLFQDVLGCNYFLAYNGVMRYGASLEDTDPEWGADWYFPMFRSLAERAFQREARERWGKYVVAYWPPYGMYQLWLKQFPLEQIYDLLAHIADARGDEGRIVLIGAKWDEEAGGHDQLLHLDEQRGKIVDLTGKTTLEQALGLLRGAAGVIGHPSGISMLPVIFHRPAYLFWNKFFGEPFWWNALPRDSHRKWYRALDTENVNVPEVAEQFLDSIKEYALDE